MAQKLNPFSGKIFVDSNGVPRSGAKLFVYDAGTSNKATVTSDSAGTVNHTNPIILNSDGEIADTAGAAKPIWQPDLTPVKLVLAPSGDTDPPVAAIDTWDNIIGINDTDTIAQDQWIAGTTPKYISATSFTVAGDLTSTYHVGRRIKTTNSAGTIYSTITATAYTTLTTVTVVNDSGSLDSGLSAVYYSMLTSENPAIPADLTKIRNLTLSGVLNLSKGADIASATALTVGSDGNYFDVTGTTAITSINTVAVGTVIKLHFDSALTLTHHATDLILPGAANITTAAGDEAEFIEYAAGDWRCVNYNRADGSAITTPNISVAGNTFSHALWYKGTGDDGAKTVSSSENLSSGEYHYTSLTVNSGQTLGISDTSGFLIIRVTGTATIIGTISADGKGSAGGAVGAAGTAGKLGGSGGSGGSEDSLASGAGGASGHQITIAGGTSSTNAAGKVGTSLASSARNIRNIMARSADLDMVGGAGGGGGNGGGGGGAGGRGGGIIMIIADTIDFQSGATITADGNNGNNSATDGGGGGGAGGFVLLAAETMTNNGTITVTGGSGGSGQVYDGGAGGAGYSIVITD